MTYPQMAHELGLTFCRGIDKRGFSCRQEHHFNGSATPGTIHWTERPVTKAATWDFLLLAVMALYPKLDEHVPWRRIYLRDKIARDLARAIHVRFPASFFDRDKAFVLAGVAGVSNEVPMRKQAYDWARR